MTLTDGPIAPVHVLYIGDEPRETDLALPALERTREQFTVSTAGASDGLASVREAAVDCLLVDGRSFGGSLDGFLADVRQDVPGLPIVLILGEGADTVTAAFDPSLATEFIRRSDAADVDRLATRVRTVTDRVERDQQAKRERDKRAQRERVLRELHDVGTDLPGYDSVETICERTVEAAETVLEFDNCAIMLAEDGCMRPVALSDEFPGGEFDPLPIDDSVAGHTYRTGEPMIVDDANDHPIANPQGPYRSGLSTPLEGHGTCQMISESEGAFDEEDRELAELLVAHAQAALDRLARETALREQNERLEQFASVLSHDLRNPLNVAHGRVQLAQQTDDSEQLGIALDALNRMDALIDNLLTLARDGQDLGTIQPVSLGTLAGSCWRTVETNDATLETGGDVTLRADRARLQQLLENLIRNAIEHAGDGVTVEIGALDDGFYVADDGPGIPADERAGVFEIGHSADQGGTGFGLAIVERIVDAHGWDIEVRQSDAGGACFAITGVETGE